MVSFFYKTKINMSKFDGLFLSQNSNQRKLTRNLWKPMTKNNNKKKTKWRLQEIKKKIFKHKFDIDMKTKT